jgi:hypothetical protein
MMHSYEWRDEHDGRAVARLVLHDGKVYLETEGNHDGTVVFTRVVISRPKFAEGVKTIGGLL